MESILPEFPVVFKMIILEYTLAPLSTLKFSLEFIVGAILLTHTIKRSVSEISSVILIGVFDGQPISMRQILLKFTKISMWFLIELTIPHFLLVAVHLPPKDGAFLTAIYCTRLDFLRILVSKSGYLFKQSSVGYAQIFLEIRQSDQKLAPTAHILSHDIGDFTKQAKEYNIKSFHKRQDTLIRASITQCIETPSR